MLILYISSAFAVAPQVWVDLNDLDDRHLLQSLAERRHRARAAVVSGLRDGPQPRRAAHPESADAFDHLHLSRAAPHLHPWHHAEHHEAQA